MAGDSMPAAGAAGFWTIDRLTAALGPMLQGARPLGHSAVRSISTDSRRIGEGDAFVALVGDTFDGHAFLPDVAKAGARAVVVRDARAAVGLGIPAFVVADTLEALGALGRYRRRAWGQGRFVVGVTGTNGKTTTKELLRAALSGGHEIYATAENLNNRVGVPLTLLGLPEGADGAVIEMGTSLPGEIAALRAVVEPDIAVVTSVAEGHLEGLGDVAGVLREKASIFDGAELAVTPAAQPEIGTAAAGRARRVLTAGLDEGDVRADRWAIEADGFGWIEIGGVRIVPPVRGSHTLRNAMLAVAVAHECGVSLAAAATGIRAMPAPAMRSAVEQMGRATLLNDAYNANPGSMRAAIALLEQMGAGRQRVAVLGTMRELGAHSDRLHDEIARLALRSSIELIAGIGEMATALERAAGRDGRVIAAPDVDEVWPLLAPRLQSDAVILLKASRGVRLERLAPQLTRWGNDLVDHV